MAGSEKMPRYPKPYSTTKEQIMEPAQAKSLKYNGAIRLLHFNEKLLPFSKRLFRVRPIDYFISEEK
jgi:hypothetical protein